MKHKRSGIVTLLFRSPITVREYVRATGSYYSVFPLSMPVTPLTQYEPMRFTTSWNRGQRIWPDPPKNYSYAQVKAFFNFVIGKCCPDMKNPCSAPLLSKTFRMPKQAPKVVLDKEVVDEMIYNTKNPRNRLMLELMARCGLRIGELFGLRVSDFFDRKFAINTPKSGKEGEVAFMPEPIVKRLNDFIKSRQLSPHEHIFPVCYSKAGTFVRKLGARLNVVLSPHDLRRYSATYASRNGVPLEIVSKVILRYQDLKTTQVYLGKVSEHEAIRWMDILHDK